MRVHEFCFASAVAAGLAGMCLGLAMGMTEEFTLSPAHAHLNLLGWVTMALMGLYYRGAGSAYQALARVQAGLAAAGFWLMPLSLGALLWTEDDRLLPLVAAGSLLALGAMVLFGAVVVLDIRDRAGTRRYALHPESG